MDWTSGRPVKGVASTSAEQISRIRKSKEPFVYGWGSIGRSDFSTDIPRIVAEERINSWRFACVNYTLEQTRKGHEK
jgi:hypothetical protein